MGPSVSTLPLRQRDDAAQSTRRRLFAALACAQVLGGLGQSGAAGGSLLARAISGSDAVASLPLAMIVLGSAALVMPISELSRRRGRRLGLTTALVTGGLGAVGTVGAGVLGSLPLLLLASVLFGAGNCAVMLSRYAAADLALPSHRARAISLVVVATTLGAVAGPNLLAPAGRAAAALGLPPLTGLFLLSAASYLAAAAVLMIFLRPDPLYLAGRREQHGAPARRRPPLRALLASTSARAGLASMAVANLTMVGVMAMAPVHLAHGGHGLAFIGFVISAHVAGMFAPAPVTGWLTDRFGAPVVATLGAGLLVMSGVVVGVGEQDIQSVSLGLVLLGVGWNASLIAGSTLLAGAVPAADRPRAEGVGELSMGVVAIAGTALAGPLVSVISYAGLAGVAAGIAAALAPALLAVARRGASATAAPAAARLLG
jgi:MFS family permease